MWVYTNPHGGEGRRYPDPVTFLQFNHEEFGWSFMVLARPESEHCSRFILLIWDKHTIPRRPRSPAKPTKPRAAAASLTSQL